MQLPFPYGFEDAPVPRVGKLQHMLTQHATDDIRSDTNKSIVGISIVEGVVRAVQAIQDQAADRVSIVSPTVCLTAWP